MLRATAPVDQHVWEAFLPAQPRARAEVDVSESTLARILDAAGQVFARSGIAEARMAQVAAEASVSKPTLYRYVEGKQSLVAQYFLREARRELAEMLATHWRDDLDADGLAAMLLDLLNRARRHPVVAKLLEDEWDEITIAAARSMVGGTGRTVVELGAWLFERAGIADPMVACEVNLRLLASLLFAPPFVASAADDDIRRFLVLPRS